MPGHRTEQKTRQLVVSSYSKARRTAPVKRRPARREPAEEEPRAPPGDPDTGRGGAGTRTRRAPPADLPNAK
ncbi:hypothetical protein GCM10020366_44090 [Saccharopolyspora gregorii]|uniref:Uncharacterized protein n=1 Tax=Saccharopolyspora gregorii TaxID=33914 RepID=A0ABP6RTY9_9PSEU